MDSKDNKKDEVPAGGFGIKLDSIFEEVEKNLPTVDFDLSDVSSDEDVAIFQRTIKTPTFDEDKDFDESLGSYSWHEILGSENIIPDNDILAQRIQSGVTDSLTTYDTGDSQSELNLSTVSLRSIQEVDHETDTPSTAGKNSQRDKNSCSIGTSTEENPNDIKINTWTGVEMGGDSQSPATRHEKRREVPELSPPPPPPAVGGREDKNRDKNRKEEDNQRRTRPSTQELVSMYIPHAAPSLTFQDLDNVDLDAALGVREGARPMSLSLRQSTRPSTQPSTSQNKGAIGNVVMQDDDDDNVSLIEKLARLSVAQSGQAMREYNGSTVAISAPPPDPSPVQRPTSAPALGTKEAKTAKNRDMEAQQRSQASLAPKKSRVPPAGPPPTAAWGGTPAVPGTSGVPFGEGFMSQLPTPAAPKPEPKTIFIDLRNFDVEKHQQQMSFEAVQRILNLPPPLQPEVDSSSDEEGDTPASLSLWHEQRRKMKEAFKAGKTLKDLDHFETEKKTKDEEESAPSLPGPEKVKGEAALSVEEEGASSSTAVSAETPSKPPLPSPVQDKEKQRRAEAAKKARETREAEHQSRLRLQKRIEALRPIRTPSDRNPAAETTPVIFDLEASYEPAPQSLPPDLPQDRDVLLLTVHMSCNGEIVLHRSSANRSVDSGHGLSASYTTLVTWILSLVPDDFSFLKSPSGGSTESANPQNPPFQVLGLQQMVLEDQMALYIAVCPREPTPEVSSKSKRGKKRDDFSSTLTKYLSTNTLHTVCPWLQDLVSMEVTSPLSDDQTPFIYRPPLPNITSKPLSTFIQVTGDLPAVRKVFDLPVGFFWYTVETDETMADVEIGESGVEYDTQNTMSLVYKRIYRDARAMMGILNRILQEGLDLAGLRLLYPTQALMSVAAGNPAPKPSQSTSSAPDSTHMLNNIGPILALAIHGTFARTLWLDAIGPADPVLARRIDPNSLCALYGGTSRDECLLFCPRNPERIQTELVRWFGGRVPLSGVVNVGITTKKRHGSGGKRTKGGKSSETTSAESEAEIPTHNPPAMLTATISGDVIMVISPLVPPRCLGLILSTCQRRGYQLRGIRRLRLTPKRASCLGMDSRQVSAFTSGKVSLSEATPFTDINHDLAAGDAQTAAALPTTVLLMRKENGLHMAASLIENLMVQHCLMDLLGPIQTTLSEPLTSSLLFHTIPHCESYMNVLGRDFSKVPEGDRVITPGYIAPKLYTNPEMEQIAVVTFTGHQCMKNFGLIIGRLLGVVPLSKAASGPPVSEGFELLGMKWLPSLSLQHAKELTPHEVGDPQWRPSIQALTSEPAVVIALRGVNAFQRLESYLSTSITQSRISQRSAKASLERLVSSTPDGAYRQMALFFWDHELFTDASARKMLLFLPPVRPARSQHDEGSHGPQKAVKEHCVEESILNTMLTGARPLATVLVAKPDVVRKNLGKLLKRISQEGFTVVGMRLEVLTDQQADRVIPTEDKENDVLREMHVSYLKSAPSLIMCLQRENAVYRLQQVLGPTDPQTARRLGQHFWRAIFGSDAIANGLHGSKDYRSAMEEVHLFFPDGLCCKPNPDLLEEEVCCPVVDDVVDDTFSRLVQPADLLPGASLPIATTKSSGTIPVDWKLPVSSLTEINCILLMPSLLKQNPRTKKADFVTVVDALLTNRFDLVGARLVWFTESQAEQYLCLINAGSFQLVPTLTSGPCLVLALQRDNAVIAFEALLGSTYVKDSVFSKYGASILRPKDQKQAKRNLGFFFDKLSPGAQLKITSPEETTAQQSTPT